MVERDIMGPGTGDGAHGKFTGTRQGFPQGCQHAIHWGDHQGCPGSDETELFFSRSPEFALQGGQVIDAGGEVQGQRAGTDGFLGPAFKCQGEVDEPQRVRIARDGLDGKHDAGGARLDPQRGFDAGIAKPQPQSSRIDGRAVGGVLRSAALRGGERMGCAWSQQVASRGAFDELNRLGGRGEDQSEKGILDGGGAGRSRCQGGERNPGKEQHQSGIHGCEEE